MLRVAIIGLGAVTRNIHLPAYAQIKDRMSLVGACDPDSAARAYVREKWPLAEVYETEREMIAKTEPDIVAICTPPALHHEQTLMALDHGCHVFCEKPLAESLNQVDEIIQASDRAQRFVVVNNQFPYMNIHMTAKKLIDSPEFGRLLFLNAWQTFRTTENTEAGWRGQLQRRVCFEFGIHIFELIRFFFEDTPIRVLAHMPNPLGALKSDALNIISVEFSDGRAATIVLDRLSKGPERYLDMRLDGEFASIHTSIGGRVGFKAGLHTREKRPFIGLDFVQGGKAVLQQGNRETVIAKDGINPFASSTAVHLRNFIDAVHGGETPGCTAKDNRNTLALVFAAYDSAELRKAVEMSEYAAEKVEYAPGAASR
ncbi:MAG: Gfo/Idh/MocA family oxidoreductase [Pyrinomonadaceae bacterium]|jgi:predicted dehydrogenase|nr:Gfo/Idh/MocA family oxidoreductase [Pyrinomonadaceae bacterium]